MPFMQPDWTCPLWLLFFVRLSQEKILCSLVLKLKVFNFRVLTGHTTRCITRAALFFKNVPGTFFQRDASGKSNCNRSFRGQPSGWNRLLVVMCSTSTRILYLISTNFKQRAISSYHFNLGLYLLFCGEMVLTFNNVTFLFKIDHDDGTVKHILSHLNTT